MSNPNIEVIIESTEITKGKLAGEVLIKVINKGLGDIRFLTLNLKENDNFQVLSQSNSVYIGNLESDDFDTASFKIRINSLSEKVEIPVFLNYRSDNNELSEYSASLELKMFGEEELNDPKNNNALIILILVIVVVVSGVIYRKKKLWNMRTSKKFWGSEYTEYIMKQKNIKYSALHKSERDLWNKRNWKFLSLIISGGNYESRLSKISTAKH